MTTEYERITCVGGPADGRVFEVAKPMQFFQIAPTYSAQTYMARDVTAKERGIPDFATYRRSMCDGSKFVWQP